jgi:hypothetical protein
LPKHFHSTDKLCLPTTLICFMFGRNCC